MTVMEKPPTIAPALLQEIENRIVYQQQQPPLQRPVSPLNCLLSNSTGLMESASMLQPPPLSPPPVLTTPSSTASTSSCASPSKPTSLRQRRTGLTTVLETTGKTLSGRISIAKEPYSLHLPADRNPLHRRMSEGAPIFAQFKQQQQLQHHQPSCMTTGPLPPTPSLPSSTDQSPCEIKALQEEYMQLSKETRLSQDSGHSSSGYHSPQFLRPPSPPRPSIKPEGRHQRSSVS